MIPGPLYYEFPKSKAKGILEIEGVIKRAVDSMSVIPGSEVKVTSVYDF